MLEPLRVAREHLPRGVPVIRPLAVAVAGVALAAIAHAEPLPALPPSDQVDPDLAQAIDDARAELAAGRASDAVRTIVRMELSDDRFTVAQRAALTPAARQLLRDAARAHEAAGRLDLAAHDLDAAWQLDARGHDPEVARVLSAWAAKLEAQSAGEALYLARRAETADPDNPIARAIDLRLSHNRHKWLGYTLELVGAAAALTGCTLLYLRTRAESDLTGSIHSTAAADQLLSDRATYTYAGSAVLAAGVVALAAGIAALAVGAPREAPVSPLLLPALPEGPR